MGLDFEPRRDALMAFATPIAQIRVTEAAEINPALRRAVLDKETSDPGRARSNVGGWHSHDDLLSWPDPAVAVLTASIEQAVHHMMALVMHPRRFEIAPRLQAWANVSRGGDYHALHTHPQNHWSGVYYVDAGTPAPERPRSGVLELQDPRGCIDMVGLPGNPFGRSIAVSPVTGVMVVFPSWLYHWVNPYHGTGERISISFNARITRFKLLDGEADAPTG